MHHIRFRNSPLFIIPLLYGIIFILFPLYFLSDWFPFNLIMSLMGAYLIYLGRIYLYSQEIIIDNNGLKYIHQNSEEKILWYQVNKIKIYVDKNKNRTITLFLAEKEFSLKAPNIIPKKTFYQIIKIITPYIKKFKIPLEDEFHIVNQ